MPASVTSSDTPVPAAPAPVDVERVVACVRGLGLRFFLDDEGDLGIPWRYVTVHVIFQDTRAIQLRGVWHRIADTDHLAALRRLVEEWNATRIGPKTYLTIADGGIVRLHGEVTYPLKAGMTDAQLDAYLAWATALTDRCAAAFEKALPLTRAGADKED